jgi:imidazole glycerol-phosphate synthase subunit HisF
MVAARIIACLDVKDGRVVKGTNFVNLRDQGDPVELARRYDEEGIDELVFLDISATNEGRKARATWVSAVAAELSIPFTVGGGVTTPDDVRDLLRSGADKVAINSAAVKRPALLTECADRFGAQCIVLAVDAKKDADTGGPSVHRVYVNAGKTATELHAETWAEEGARLGAGEILLTSMDRDGTKTGFDVELLEKLRHLSVPVIASGGAGTLEHFDEGLSAGASAVLAASLFHERTIEVSALKAFLDGRGHRMRIA